MFASRRRDSYLEFSELHPLPGTGPIELVDGLRAVTTMLSAVIRVAPADTRAIIWRRPVPETGSPDDFAARGGLELILHARDVCRGLEVAFDPPRDVCERLRDHTQHWPGHDPIDVTDDPWSDVLRRSGRPSN